MSAEPETMREVVKDLLANGAGALLELQELQYAVIEILRSLAELSLAARGLCREMEGLESAGSVRAGSSVPAAQERAVALNTLAQQILEAFRQIDMGIEAWGLSGADDESPLPPTVTRRH